MVLAICARPLNRTRRSASKQQVVHYLTAKETGAPAAESELIQN
jgi:hypothetical protein